MEWSKYGLKISIALLMISLALSSSLAAVTFNVGGKDGWVVNPSEAYTHWAQRYRFHVNDTLYFRYKRGTNSVLIVTKEDYDSCNTTKPLHRFRGGGSTIKLHKSGSFFFISGNADKCKQGQKLIVLVMATTHTHPHPPAPHSPSPSPSPSTPPSTATPSKPPSTTTPPPAKSPFVAPVTPNAPAPSPSKNSGSKTSSGVALGIGFLMMVFFSNFA